jgi:uncharacterized protein YceH (UPF0502 family)
MHLLSGEFAAGGHDSVTASPERATLSVESGNERLAQLQEEVVILKEELANLRRDFLDFKDLFD